MEDVRREAHAALEARRELGPEYEDPVVEAFLERVEKRLAPAEAEERAARGGQQFVLALSSIGMGIPITAIAADAGTGGVLVAWLGIALVNMAFALRR